MHIQHLMPAGIDQRLHNEPGETPPPELFKRKDTVNFVPVRMQPATRYCSERPVDKGAEDAVFSGVRPPAGDNGTRPL